MEIIKLPENTGTIEAFSMGVDCEKNGANEINCNFRLFSTQEKTKAWERGKAIGELDKKKK